MDTEQVVTLAVTGVGALIGGAGGAEIIKALTGRKPRRVVAVDNEVKLAQQAAAQAKASADYAQQMEQSARNAWAQAHAAEERAGTTAREAQVRVDGMERKVDDVEFRLSIVSRYTVWLLTMIGEPSMTMDMLRDNVARRRPPAGVGVEEGS